MRRLLHRFPAVGGLLLCAAMAKAEPCIENFDSVTAPMLPPEWVATNLIPGDGIQWVTSIVDPDTAPNDAFIPDQAGISDKILERSNFVVTAAPEVFLAFRNNFNMEFSGGTYRDGGVLEVSAPNINEGAFTDVMDPAVGASFVSGGYTGRIDSTTGNPLAGRMAWSGDSGGYIDTVVNLGPNLKGQTIRLRFRMGTDNAGAASGWRVDTMILSPGCCFCPPTPSPTSTATATAVPTATPTPTPTPTPAAQALNLSTRLLVQTGDNVGIGGFIITGNAPKEVLLRGIGPSLGNFGVPNPLADPILELQGPNIATITCDNWRECLGCGPGIICDCGLSCLNDLESEILITLNPGAYTAILRGHENAPTGVGLVEIYDLDPAASKLANISTRAFVSTGNDIVIAGFILGPPTSGNDNVIVRGIGPSLTNFGVPSALADPTLELRNSNGALIRANNDWRDDLVQAAIITGFGLALTNNLESGIAAQLSPGSYTALLAGLNGGTGVGLVEVYDLGSGTPGSTPTPTPTSGIVLVSRLSDARAYAVGGAGDDNPPPEMQTDFLPASLSNNAMSYGEPGGADGHCTSNSQIAVDNQIGPLQVTGDGMARAGAGKPGGFLYYAWASAKLIVISFTLTDRSYAYSLTGQLSASGETSGVGHSNLATAKLTTGGVTILEVIADNSIVTLAETGILQPDNYTLAVDIDAFAEAPSSFGNSSANFNFALGPTPTPIAASDTGPGR